MASDPEAQFRKFVAARLATAGAAFVRAGLIPRQHLLDLQRSNGSGALSVRENFWVNHKGSRGEVDILVPSVRAAFECKVQGKSSRVNWEEALGQAVRDRELDAIDIAYIAIPAGELDEWGLSSCRQVNVGVLIADPGAAVSGNFKFVAHPAPDLG